MVPAPMSPFLAILAKLSGFSARAAFISAAVFTSSTIKKTLMELSMPWTVVLLKMAGCKAQNMAAR
ncbi:hypothetical protein SDC9_153294 [bioreactor metagenome]|uniref:Uncharacterized protein n=1 Tax=bioreactor metagenome TaxID=1076179 RepID=A0A645EX54_9ZZZZ